MEPELARAELAPDDEDGEVPYIRFDAEAQEVFDGWRAEFEPRFRSAAGEYPAAIESHFMKYRSLFASLALIFEAVDFVDDAEGAGKAVKKTSALRAAAWCEYLESHAMRVYSPTLDVATAAAKTLLDRLEVGDVSHGEIWRRPGRTTRSPRRHCRGLPGRGCVMLGEEVFNLDV